mmetsp:Transcript_44375/g.53639  ORF Transcript_44375/g.53639 Transcript_44375/m.53639 type:complete len:177 (+) Transcript_44375:161-691(+)
MRHFGLFICLVEADAPFENVFIARVCKQDGRCSSDNYYLAMAHQCGYQNDNPLSSKPLIIKIEIILCPLPTMMCTIIRIKNLVTTLVTKMSTTPRTLHVKTPLAPFNRLSTRGTKLHLILRTPQLHRDIAGGRPARVGVLVEPMPSFVHDTFLVECRRREVVITTTQFSHDVPRTQ